MKKKEDLNIIFMGTPEFSVAILDALVESKYTVKAVVTVPDKPAGRGQKIRESAVKKRAEEYQITVLQPESLKEESFIKELESMNPDLFIVVAFRMLPKVVWGLPSLGTFNLHASLLPQYRGAAPINWAIINGEKETGVTTFFIDENIDTGKIILSEKMAIGENETAGELHDRMMEVGAKVVLQTVELIREGKVNPIQQIEKDLLPAPKIQKRDCKIDFYKSPQEIHDFVRGMSPYPTAWMRIRNKNNQKERTLKIFSTLIISAEKSQEVSFVIIEDKLAIQTLEGLLIIEELQLEGKSKMDSSSFIKGFNIADWEIITN